MYSSSNALKCEMRGLFTRLLSDLDKMNRHK